MEVATFRNRFQKHGVEDGARVLHLGCGGGSIDFHLKQYYQVTGVDLSEAMLAHARRLNPEVKYHQGDIRSFRNGQLFDAVLVHDAIAYMTSIDELRATYRTAAVHLRPGGVMVALPEEVRNRLVQHRSSVTTRSEGDRTVTILTVDYDPDETDNSYETTFVYVIREGDSVRVEMDRHRNGVFEIEQFVSAVEAAGFAATVDPWELSDWEPDIEPMPLITAVRGGPPA